MRTSISPAIFRASAQAESLVYDPEGRLATATITGTAPDTVRFGYDADGNRLLRRDDTTMYLGPRELTLTRATGVISAARYYRYEGHTVAARSSETAAATVWSDLNDTAAWQVDCSV